MSLDILVNHYQEDDETVRRFLDSLAAQTEVSFSVYIVSDGGRRLPDDILSGRPFPICYAWNTHSGVCHTRNLLMDKAQADYLMFCDIDDCFQEPDGLRSILGTANETGADIVESPFLCERKQDDGFQYTTIEHDTIHLHGKIFRRGYLLEHQIRFPDEMETSGDMFFLWLAYALTNRIVCLRHSFYIWKWNPDSVTRKLPFHRVRTYDRTLRCYTLLAEELKRRNAPGLYQNLIATVFGMMYVDSTHPVWRIVPKELREHADQAIFRYLSLYFEDYRQISEDFRRNKYLLMLRYRKAENLSGPFEEMLTWARKRLEQRKHGTGVLIVGYGTVGFNLLKELAVLEPDVYDKYRDIDGRKPGERYAVAFVCVNTPRTKDCVCDISEVRNALAENEADVYVLKSTVLPGTTEALRKETGKRVIFSPEYYGGTQHSKNFRFDYTILGGEKADCIRVVQLLQRVYDGRHQFRMTDARTAELAKYMENAYLAVKVSFCCQFHQLAEKLGISYEELRELFVLDPRVEPSHTFVYAEHPYWDSRCLNKDVPAIAEAFDASFLKSVIEYNEQCKN